LIEDDTMDGGGRAMQELLPRIVILGSGILLRSTSCILAVVLSKSITQEMILYRLARGELS
jgi:hypothetical protein